MQYRNNRPGGNAWRRPTGPEASRFHDALRKVYPCSDRKSSSDIESVVDKLRQMGVTAVRIITEETKLRQLAFRTTYGILDNLGGFGTHSFLPKTFLKRISGAQTWFFGGYI